MRLFGKRPPSALDLLRGAAWTCAQCGLEHQGMFDLALGAPDHWDGDKVAEPNWALRFDGDFLSNDFCVLGGEDFFVRCVFEIPVHGMDRKFGYGVWSSLSRANFELYVHDFFRDGDEDLGPWTGWFSNGLKGVEDTLNQPCWVHPPPGGQRPLITLHKDDHELARAQIEGITPERLLELYTANGHGPAR